MLSASEMAMLIEQCAKFHVTKFSADSVSFTFSGHREPVSLAAGSMEQLLAPQGDPWLAQVIPPSPLPAEVD